jgi:hypothetical protein
MPKEEVPQVVVVCRDCGRVDVETLASMEGRKVIHPKICRSCRGDRRLMAGSQLDGEVEVPPRAENTEASSVALVNNRFFNRRTKVTHSESHTEELVSVHLFHGPTALVRRGYGLTLNLGDYEAARLDVSLTVPCYLADIDAADKYAAEWCSERITQEVQEIRGNQTKKLPSGKKPPEF